MGGDYGAGGGGVGSAYLGLDWSVSVQGAVWSALVVVDAELVAKVLEVSDRGRGMCGEPFLLSLVDALHFSAGLRVVGAAGQVGDAQCAQGGHRRPESRRAHRRKMSESRATPWDCTRWQGTVLSANFCPTAIKQTATPGFCATAVGPSITGRRGDGHLHRALGPRGVLRTTSLDRQAWTSVYSL